LIGFNLAATMIPLPAANVLSNPGFEADPAGETAAFSGWTAYGGNAYSETGPATAHSGTNYFKVYQAFNGQLCVSVIEPAKL